MRKENLYQLYHVEVLDMDECPMKEHQHSFFEMVYIVSGTGEQCINKNTFRYQPGHLFLLAPEDCHSFNITTTTRFFFIRFNEAYLQSSAALGHSRNDQLQRLQYILQNVTHQPGCVLKNLTDKHLVHPVIEAIIREYNNRDLYNKELIRQLMDTLILVVARNIARTLPEEVNERSEEKILDMLQYIQRNIYLPYKLKTAALSRKFGIAEAYLGRYFKKHTNETLQQFITGAKLKLVEHRLLHSNLRISEIVEELSFTDESHLNRIFKKYRGMSPGDFRRAAGNKKAPAVRQG